jgi:hypothetical protein
LYVVGDDNYYSYYRIIDLNSGNIVEETKVNKNCTFSRIDIESDGINLEEKLYSGDYCKEVKTYKDALNYILENGPEHHVHTILQVDKPDNLLGEDIITSKIIFRKFRHLVMLRSDEKAALKLGIPDEIRLENLNSEQERLRAVYYADGDDGWTLFSPFAVPNESELSNLTKE